MANDKKAEKQRIKAARAAVVAGYELLGTKQISPKDVVFVKRQKRKESPYFYAYKLQVGDVFHCVRIRK
jgi:hypothetical protein